MQCERIGDVALTWGESLRWDDRRQRLYFVDCAAQTLHWLDDLGGPVQSMQMPSMPAGLALTDTEVLVACLDDGLHVVDPDAGETQLLARYPEGMRGRANDAHADGFGNLITGTLNIVPGPGSLYWFSRSDGWRELDDDIGNTNGPLVIGGDRPMLVCGDTNVGTVFSWPYDPDGGRVGAREVFADHTAMGGTPDGATVDDRDGVWSCVLRQGKVARFTADGLDRVVEVDAVNPSDVTFGGAELDTLFVTSIAVDLGDDGPLGPDAGALLAIRDVGFAGRPEPRFALT